MEAFDSPVPQIHQFQIESLKKGWSNSFQVNKLTLSGPQNPPQPKYEFLVTTYDKELKYVTLDFGKSPIEIKSENIEQDLDDSKLYS